MAPPNVSPSNVAIDQNGNYHHRDHREGEVQCTSFPKDQIKVLLLEGISTEAREYFERECFQVEVLKSSLGQEQLKQKIADVHIVGVRSKTRLTESVLQCAKRLKAIGCFCIGTDQVDLDAAERMGVPVFNSPFLNTRSVAELVMAEIVFLARQAADRSMEMHAGKWRKTANGCHEIRGMKLGIVGYGHVGSQVSLLAEAFGMRVFFYDTDTKLPLGNAQAVQSLEDILTLCDVVTLHVPKTADTTGMIGRERIAMMKPGSYLLNLARGSVVDVDALADALKSGHLAGCAVDVFPKEPSSSATDDFYSPLQGCPNTILTPHVGGSTVEAQRDIAVDVARKMTTFINTGCTQGAVNFPNIVPPLQYKHRLLNVHYNRPGALRLINEILSDYNVSSQVLGTTPNIGYMVIDVDSEVSKEVLEKICERKDVSIRTRILF